ncbi:MAG: hypothetical protein GXP24_02985 [Planctomycetes bacterium]|nr:hypothetical protein [Planctomycetota bacterium]
MPFKLPKLPSLQAKAHELADFAELIAWECGKVSEREIIAYLGRVGDNEKNEGVNDTEEETTDLLPEVMNEIDRRAAACRDGYPFKLTLEGTVLKYDKQSEDKIESQVYRYLLLSTRLNMSKSKKHAGLDGTLLLEELAAHVLQNYLGGRAKSLVFGTAKKGKFKDKVNHLCKSLNEGVGFKNLDGNSKITAVDDKLDAVAWTPFADALPGQLIVLGQCKTGTNWSELKTQLQPENFAKKWFKEPFLITPIRAFCLSEAIDRTKWKSVQTEAGILFDRCRLVDFCDGFVSQDIVDWTDAAFGSFEVGDLNISG